MVISNGLWSPMNLVLGLQKLIPMASHRQCWLMKIYFFAENDLCGEVVPKLWAPIHFGQGFIIYVDCQWMELCGERINNVRLGL